MISMNLNYVKTHLSDCIAQAEKGESVIICRRNKPVAEIRGIPQAKTEPRSIGLLKGQFTVPDSFFEPLPNDVLDAFEGHANEQGT